ncbi:MAG: hypothetical protein M1416_01695 [Candidatus Pacearchaeota archaeon]|nr:hypothetical protein [Candidatus Pacearchaeota archaeon]
MEETIFLNLDNITLLGWEDNKSSKKVERMIEDLKRGDILPPVPVIKINDAVYSLVYISDYDVEGGHYRAIAHNKIHKPLKCISSKGLPVPRDDSIPITKIKIL